MHSPMQRPSSPPLLRAARILGCWACLYLFYLLLVDTDQTAELVAAAVVAGLAAGALVVAAAQGLALGPPRLRWLALLAWRLPGKALKDCAIVLAALWRQAVLRQEMEGAFRVVRFDPGGDDPRSAARRALIIAAISLPPNSYVVSTDAKAGRLVIHNLVPSAQPRGGPDVEWPV